MVKMEYKEEKTNWAAWVEQRLANHPYKKNLKHAKIAWCEAFYRGDQYKLLDEKTGAVRDVNITRETRCIYNVCKPFANAYVAKMLKGDPTPYATPYSTNTEEFDEDQCVAVNAAVEFWWKSVAMAPLKLRSVTNWATRGGIGFAKIYYDKNAKTGMYPGEVVWERVNPLHVFANADAQDDTEFREVIHRFPKEKSVAEEEFAEQMKALGVTELPSTPKADAASEHSELSKLIDEQSDAEVKSTVMVNDVWIRACKKYPNGKHLIVIGPHTLVEEDNPEPDMVPFFAYRVNPLEDDLFGMGMLRPIIMIQRDMNKLNSIIQENASLMGHVKWLVPEASNLLPGALDDASGEKVLYSGDRAPTQSQAAPLPNHIVSRFWELFRMAQFITGQQDVGMGMVPYRGSQIATGVTQELKNSEDTIFAPDVAQMIEFVQKVVRRYLFLARKYYKEERIAVIIGENKRPEAKAFFAPEFADQYNVDIQVGGGFAKSNESKVGQIQSLMQSGAFDKSGIDPRLIMEETLKMVGLTKIREDSFKDERQARRNLRRIVSGEDVITSRFINPIPHIKIFTDFTKMPEYEVLPVEIQTGIDRYIDSMVAMTQGAPNGQPPPVGAGENGAPGTPGNMPPQMPTPEEAAAADANQRLATGQPTSGDLGQAGQEPAPM
jgi:hypothetical protein